MGITSQGGRSCAGTFRLERRYGAVDLSLILAQVSDFFSFDCFKPSCLCRAPSMAFTGRILLWMNILCIPDGGEKSSRGDRGLDIRPAAWEGGVRPCATALVLSPSSGWLDTCPCHVTNELSAASAGKTCESRNTCEGHILPSVTWPSHANFYGVGPLLLLHRWIWGVVFKNCNGMRVTAFLTFQAIQSASRSSAKVCFSAVTPSTGKLHPAPPHVLGGLLVAVSVTVSCEHVEEEGYRLFPGCWDSVRLSGYSVTVLLTTR